MKEQKKFKKSTSECLFTRMHAFVLLRSPVQFVEIPLRCVEIIRITFIFSFFLWNILFQFPCSFFHCTGLCLPVFVDFQLFLFSLCCLASKCIYKYRIGWKKKLFKHPKPKTQHKYIFFDYFLSQFLSHQNRVSLIFVSRMSCFCYDPSIDRTQRRIETKNKNIIEYFVFCIFYFVSLSH